MTLTLMIAKRSFHRTLRLIVMHHRTRSGYKGLNGSENTTGQICNGGLNLRCNSKTMFQQVTLAHADVPLNKF